MQANDRNTEKFTAGKDGSSRGVYFKDAIFDTLGNGSISKIFLAHSKKMGRNFEAQFSL